MNYSVFNKKHLLFFLYFLIVFSFIEFRAKAHNDCSQLFLNTKKENKNNHKNFLELEAWFDADQIKRSAFSNDTSEFENLQNVVITYDVQLTDINKNKILQMLDVFSDIITDSTRRINLNTKRAALKTLVSIVSKKSEDTDILIDEFVKQAGVVVLEDTQYLMINRLQSVNFDNHSFIEKDNMNTLFLEIGVHLQNAKKLLK